MCGHVYRVGVSSCGCGLRIMMVNTGTRVGGGERDWVDEWLDVMVIGVFL